MLTRKGSSAGPELYGGHDDTALAHGLVDMASRFCYWLNFVGWVWSDSAQVLVTNLGGLASVQPCVSRWLPIFSSGFPVKLVFRHFFLSLILDTRD